MNNLPSEESLKLLLTNKFYKECVTLATFGINQLLSMYAGRGGAFNVNRCLPQVKSLFGNYLDALYWSHRMLLNTYNSHNTHGDGAYCIAMCEFIGMHLLKVGYYEPLVFEKAHSKVRSIMNHPNIHLAHVYHVHMSCMWTNTHTLYKDWSHLFENYARFLGYTCETNKITFMLTEDKEKADYFVIVWGSRESYTEEQLSRAIFFRTEPTFPEKILLGTEIKAEPLKFLKYYDYHDLRFPNCIEYWLNKKPSVLLSESPIEKPEGFKCCLSTVVSNKYVDPGHIYRIDLLRHIVSNIHHLNSACNAEPKSLSGDLYITNDVKNVLHIYGFDNTLGFPDKYYYGALPERDKSVLMKYRYTLIAENHSIPGYMTEKIADGVLSECLVFYWGCPNIQTYFPPVDGILPYVVLPMDDKIASYEFIKTAIREDWWSQRILAIRATKKLILTKFMMRHRIVQVIREDVDRKLLGDDAMNTLRLAMAVEPTAEHKGVNVIKNILYTGARYEELKELVLRRTENRVKFEYFDGLSEDIPNESGTILIQEFSNKPSFVKTDKDDLFLLNNEQKLEVPVYHYTIGFTRFSIRNHHFANTLPKTFVVNLDRRPDRLLKFGQRFPRVGEWTYEIFSAIDGNKLKINGEFPESIQHLFRNNDFCSKNSVIGCAMSHIKIWQQLVNDKDSNSYIIYEDDVEFVENYAWKLYSLLQNITFDWDILFLGHLMCYELQTTHRLESDELSKWESMVKYILPTRSSYVGTASYIISKRGASKLLEYIEKNGVQHGIDYMMQLLFPKLLRAYGVNPMINYADYSSCLCPRTKVDSDIQK
jgi:GR25 family glycosyltransferase involved in LPS biosynthesis